MIVAQGLAGGDPPQEITAPLKPSAGISSQNKRLPAAAPTAALPPAQPIDDIVGRLQGFPKDLDIVSANTVRRKGTRLAARRQKQLPYLNAKTQGQAVHGCQRRVPFAALDLSDELVAQSGALRQPLLREPERTTQLPEPPTEIRTNVFQAVLLVRIMRTR